MTAEVADCPQQLLVAQRAHEALELAPPASAPGQPIPELGGVGAQQALELLVIHLIDPASECRTAIALEQLAQPVAVLDRDRLPAGGFEHRLQPAGRDLGDHPIE